MGVETRRWSWLCDSMPLAPAHPQVIVGPRGRRRTQILTPVVMCQQGVLQGHGVAQCSAWHTGHERASEAGKRHR